MHVNLLLILCGLAGAWRGWEVASGVEYGSGHATARVVMIGLLFLWSALAAERFSGFLYGALMPIGAFYAARALVEAITRAQGLERIR